MRYVLHSGEVKSQNDGQVHWIDWITLVHLYQVPISLCVSAERAGLRDDFFDIHLYPKEDGDYTLPVPVSEVLNFRELTKSNAS